MDQQRCYQLNNFDPNSVDVNKPATTVEEYLRQVYVNRQSCPEVVATSINKIETTPSTSLSFKIKVDDNTSDPCPLAPSKEWQENFAKKFMKHRTKINNLKETIPKLKLKGLPPLSNIVCWKKLCLVERNPLIPIANEQLEIFEKHKGTPPTTRFVCSLSHSDVDRLIELLISAYTEIGYTRPLFEWIYSLLLVIQSPVEHGVMSSLRSFVRQCKKARSLLKENEKEKIIEYTVLIVIITLCFSQKDLADFS